MTSEDSDFDRPHSILAHARKRPGMYFGALDDGRALLTVVREMWANCVDQFLAGDLSSIEVVLHEDGSLSIIDDGPGIDMKSPGTGVSSPLERAVMVGHDTPTADGHTPHWHLNSIGGSRLGLCLVHAGSERMSVVSVRDGECRRQEFGRGSILGPARIVHERTRGTAIRVWLDPQVFPNRRWPLSELVRELERLALLCPGIATKWSAAPQSLGPVRQLDRYLELHAGGAALDIGPIVGERREGFDGARVAFGWKFDDRFGTSRIDSFCNLSPTATGKHLDGFLSGLRRGINAIARQLQRPAIRATRRSLWEADLRAVVSVEVVDATFNSPIRDNLATERVAPLVDTLTHARTVGHFEAHPEQAARLLESLESRL